MPITETPEAIEKAPLYSYTHLEPFMYKILPIRVQQRNTTNGVCVHICRGLFKEII